MSLLKSYRFIMHDPKRFKTIATSLVIGLCIACPNASADDPWETTNARVFKFNKTLDTWILRPVAHSYNAVIPRVVRQGVGNFFSNIDDINVLANDVLQLKFGDAVTDSGRLVINTTIGLVGIIDVASSIGLSKNEEDFGQTFGRWGVGPGPYVMLPFFGPSSVRDSFGLVLDTVFNPIQYHEDDSVRTLLLGMDQLDSRASVVGMEGLISGDEYLFLREAYLQQREYLVTDGQVKDDFDDWDDY